MQSEFLAMTVDPQDFNSVPPNVNNLASFTKDVTVYGSVSGLSNGALMWLPYHGAANIILMTQANGNIPAFFSYSSSAVPTINPLNIQALSGATPLYSFDFMVYPKQGYYFPLGPNTQAGSGLNVLQRVILDTSGNVSPIQISPDIVTGFSLFRSYSGYISAKSDSTSTTAAALSGEIHAAAIADIRGLRQLQVTDMVQQVTTKKDAAWSAKLYDGVTVVLGSDISSDYLPVSTRYAFDDSNGLLDDNFFSIGCGFNDPVTYTSNVSNPTVPKTSFFLVPGMQVTQPASVQNAAGASVYNLRDIPWTECYDFDVFFTVRQGLAIGPGANVAPLPGTPWGTVSAIDIYGWVDSSGNFYYQLFKSFYPVVIPNGYAIPAPKAPFSFQKERHRSPNALNLSGASLPEYPHSNFNQSFRNTFYVGTAFGCSGDVVCYVKPVQRAGSRDGACGPARFITWQNVGSGQSIQIKGLIRNQLLANSTVAPYASTQYESGSINASLIPFVSELYDSESTVFKRAYFGREYEDICSGMRREMKMVVSDQVKKYMTRDEIEDGAKAGMADVIEDVGRALHTGIDVAERAAPLAMELGLL